MPTPKAAARPVENTPLERELNARLRHVDDPTAPLDPLEQLALRVGLIQNRAEPYFYAPTLVVFAADHGIAVDDVAGVETQRPPRRCIAW